MNTNQDGDIGGDDAPVLARVDDGVGWITLNRPRRMNAITVSLAESLEGAVRDLSSAARVLVIRGAGGNFSAGGDLQEVARLRAEGADSLRRLFDAFGRACDAVGEVTVPVIAAVEGNAMAGGFELAQACDITVVSDDAVLCDNHVNHGALPGGGGSQRLPQLVGRARALGHMLSGDPLSGPDAVLWGLAYRCLPSGDFDSGVSQFAHAVAARSPAALAGIKRLVRDGLGMPLDAGLQMERSAIVEHLLGDGAEDIERAVRGAARNCT